MADTAEFFNTILPAKIADDASILDIGASFVFKIEGAGDWSVNLTDGTISEGSIDGADCTIGCAKDDFEDMLEDSNKAMQLFMTGALTADNVMLATQLQRILD